MIETIGWLIVGVGMVGVLMAFLLSMCLMAYFMWVGFRVMVRVELTPKAVRAMRVADVVVDASDRVPESFTSEDIAAAIEFGERAAGVLGRQKVGEA